MLLNSISGEKCSVGELLSIAIQSRKSERSNETSTIFVREGSMRGQFKRRFSDSSVLIFDDPPDALETSSDVVSEISKIRRKKSTDFYSQSGKGIKLASLVIKRSSDGCTDDEAIISDVEEFSVSGMSRQSSDIYNASSLSPRKNLLGLDSIASRRPILRSRSKSLREIVTLTDIRVKSNCSSPAMISRLDKLVLSTKKSAKVHSLIKEDYGHKSFARHLPEDIQDNLMPGDIREGIGRDSECSVRGSDLIRNSQQLSAHSRKKASSGSQNRKPLLILRRQISSKIPPIHTILPQPLGGITTSNIPSCSSSCSSSPISRKKITGIDAKDCQVSVEHIIAKADARSRTSNQAALARDRTIASQGATVERRSLQLRVSFMLLWNKVIIVSNTHALLVSSARNALQASRSKERMVRAAVLISLCYIRSRVRRGNLSIRRGDNLTGVNRQLALKYSIRWRFATATNRLKDFLVSCKTCSPIGFAAMYVTRFINAAKSVQACIRSFLVCKRARVLAVLKIWDAIEVQHIKDMLETQRKVESVGKTIAKETPKVQTEEPAVGGRTSSTLKRNRIQALKWIALKEKFRVFDSKSGHGFQRKIDLDIRKSYLLPLAVKTMIAENMIKDARNSALLENENHSYKIKALEQARMYFSLDDAAMLIQGPDERDPNFNFKHGVRIHPDGQTEKEAPKERLLVGMREPFILYGYLLADSVVHTHVIEAHEMQRKLTEES